LLVLPLRLERTAPGTRVTVPAALVSVRRLAKGFAPESVPRDGHTASDMQLRFQLPAEVLPLRVERGRLALRVHAPARRVTASALRASDRGGRREPVELRRVESPLDPMRVEITEARLLRPDERGGLHFELKVSGRLGRGGGRE